MAKQEDTADSAKPAAESATAASEQPFLTQARIRMLSIVGAVVVVAALVVWFMITSANRKEAFAAQALEQARSTAESGNLADAVQQYEKVTTNYSGTDAAMQATIGMAQARLVAGQTELAISTLEEFVAKNPPSNYASPANGLLGTGYEDVGRYDEALKAYQKAADEARDDYLKASLLLDAGRSAKLAGKKEEAVKIYNQIVDKFGDTAARSEAEVRLSELTAEPAIPPGK